jgi:hypothetical protein
MIDDRIAYGRAVTTDTINDRRYDNQRCRSEGLYNLTCGAAWDRMVLVWLHIARCIPNPITVCPTLQPRRVRPLLANPNDSERMSSNAFARNALLDSKWSSANITSCISCGRV